MNFVMTVRESGTGRVFEESVVSPVRNPADLGNYRRDRYKRIELTSLRQAEDYCRELIDCFNKTRRTGEAGRVFVSVREA